MSIYDEIRAVVEHLSPMSRKDFGACFDEQAARKARKCLSYRESLIRIAALCVAAVEALDREGGG